MRISNVEFDNEMEKVEGLCDYLNDILETDSLSVADLVDALASNDLRLAFDADDLMADVYIKLVKQARSKLEKQAK